MKILLDTNIVIWWLEDNKRITRSLQRLISEADVYVSAVTAWEIAIKRGNGKLKAPSNYQELLDKNDFLDLAITSHHALGVEHLPKLHADPFDRLLVVQAMLEGMTLITCDHSLAKYGPSVRVV